MKPTFADTLGTYVQRSLYSHGQLSALSGIPKNSITNWLSGRVIKPHRWEPLLKLADVLDLSQSETDLLLQSAGHQSLAELQKEPLSPEKRPLFIPWQQPKAPAPFQAITDLPYFVGRQSELAELRALLKTKRHLAIVSLFGMGGVGKTSLAAHIAYDLRDLYPDGVLWARLDSSDTMAILNMLAGVYGQDVSQYSTLDSRSAAVRGLLANKQALLVLDNAETSDQLVPLLPPSTGACAVLVTTRHDLTALDGWPQLTLRPFSETSGEALALFAHFLSETAVSQNKPSLLAIADLVGQLPLALSLVAAQLRRTPTSQTINQMHQQLIDGRSRLNHLQRENRSVRLTFDLSFAKLTATEQKLFVQLGAFGGDDFSVEAVAFVAQMDVQLAGDKLETLQQLSLLQAGQNGRFRLHLLLRDYAREKLAQWEDETVIYGRMIQYFMNRIQLGQQTDSGERAVSPTEIVHEISHLLTALETAHAHQLYEQLLAAVRIFFLPLHEQGVWHKLDNAISQLIDHAEQTADFDTMAEMLTLRSKLLWWREQDGTVTARQAVALAHRAENPHLIADALRELGSWLNRNNKFVEAEQVTLDALAIAESVGDQTKMVAILNNLGHALVQQEKWDEAQHYLERGYQLAKEINYYRAWVVLAGNLGTLLAQREEWQTAVSYFEAGVKIGREHNCLTALMGLLGDWGYEALFMNELETAQRCFAESLDIARTNNHQVSVAVRLADLGEVARRQKRFAVAQKQLTEALTIAQREKLKTWQPIIHLRLALLANDQKQTHISQAQLDIAMQTSHLLHHSYKREVTQAKAALLHL